MSPELKELLTHHVGTAYAKQLAFGDVIEDRGWGVDLSMGQVSFGNDLNYSIQLLGTEADGDKSWLWAWANAQSGLPENLLTICHALKSNGDEQAIPEFSQRSFPQTEASGHTLALVASGMHADCCYYRGPYEGGALFFLITNPPAEVTEQVKPERAIRVINEVIAQFDVNHSKMASAFLKSQGFAVESSVSSLVAIREQQVIEVSLDHAERITKIEAVIQPEKRKKKAWWRFWS